MAKRDKSQQGTQNGMVGRPTMFPGKRRDKPVQVALTDVGLSCLDRGIKRDGCSKAEYIEKLLRAEDERAKAAKQKAK